MSVMQRLLADIARNVLCDLLCVCMGGRAREGRVERRKGGEERKERRDGGEERRDGGEERERAVEEEGGARAGVQSSLSLPHLE